MQYTKQKGFSLVELIVAIAIGMIVLGAIYLVIQTGLRSSSSMEKKVTAGQDVRAALELMAMEIRMASFNPNFAAGIWKNEDGAVAALQESKGIQKAATNNILIEMDIGGSSDIGDSPNEVIFYKLDTANRFWR